MPRQHPATNGRFPRSKKTRKRVSPSSSSSSVLQNLKFKKALFAANPKRGSRLRTPAPSWRLVGSRSPACTLRIADSPGGTRATPTSARKLAATLWEMSEMPSIRKDKVRRKKVPMSVMSLAQFSDTSGSAMSEAMDRSGMCIHQREKAPSISVRHKMVDQLGETCDYISEASLNEVDTRSKCDSPRQSTVKNQLKDVSNALTTSRELLKIITRIWARGDPLSSTTSLITTLHSELERARLHVNHLIQEERSDQNEMMEYLMKCISEEREAWRNKEREVIDSAIESVAGQLEAERKLRKRLESLNKKLGRELAEVKSSYLNVSQGGAMEIMRQEESAPQASKELDDTYQRKTSKERHNEREDSNLIEIKMGSKGRSSKVGENGRQSFEQQLGRKSEHKTRKGIMGSNVLARLGSSIFFPSPTRQWGLPLPSKGIISVQKPLEAKDKAKIFK